MRGQSGIYRIDVGSTYYYGQGQDLDRRAREHANRLKRGAHTNRQLQSAYDKYSEHAFEVVLYCETTELDRYEQFFLDRYQPMRKCANVAKDAVVPMRGVTRHFTDEHRARLAAAHLGKKNGPPSEQTRTKIARAKRGRTHTDASRANMSKSKEKHVYRVTRTDGTQREYTSLVKVADAYGTTKSTVGKWANGISKPSKKFGIVSVVRSPLAEKVK